MRTVVARQDPTLGARIASRRPMTYGAGADAAADRPAHVRGASSLARVGGRLAVVQDDANFIAFVDPSTGLADAMALPRGAGGRRQLDKPSKLDLEACATDGETMLLFGSGSTPARERIVEFAGAIAVRPAPEFYTLLRREPGFGWSDLNLEGAVLVDDDTLRLFQRGNGPAGHNATCDVSWRGLVAHLRSPRTSAAPRPRNIVQYDLGAAGGSRLCFTDAAAILGAVLYVAVAEQCPDTVQDGPVVGAALGIIRDGSARWAPLANADGCKVEGISPDPANRLRAHAVVDADDPSRASELCVIDLTGAWF